MRYRKPAFYKPMFRECYAIAPGMMRHFDYDCLLLGSSMVRNFTLSDINRVFRTDKSLKLSASSASSQDLKKIADIAFQAKGSSLKTVIYALDLWASNKAEVNYLRFDFLYRSDYMEDYKYYFSRKTYSALNRLLKASLAGKPKKKRMHDQSFDTMFCTDYPGKPYGTKLVFSEARSYERSKRLPAMPNKESMPRFREDVLNLIETHPDTDFVIFLPPVSIYYWCLLGNNSFKNDAGKQQKCLDAMLKQKKIFLQELLKLKNVRIYDPQQEKDIVTNFEFYNDTTHYSMDACRIVIEGIGQEKWRVQTVADIQKNESMLRRLIQQEMPQYLQIVNRGK